MSAESRAVIRAQRALKHYKNNLLTQAGSPDQETLRTLITDLQIYCEKQDFTFTSVVKDATGADLP